MTLDELVERAKALGLLSLEVTLDGDQVVSAKFDLQRDRSQVDPVAALAALRENPSMLEETDITPLMERLQQEAADDHYGSAD